MLNYKLNAQGGFTPATISPERVLRNHRSAQGRHGGKGTVPSFIHTSILNFISMEKEFSRAKKLNAHGGFTPMGSCPPLCDTSPVQVIRNNRDTVKGGPGYRYRTFVIVAVPWQYCDKSQ